MSSVITFWLLFGCSTALATSNGPGLAMRAELDNENYCKESDGSISLRLRTRLYAHNTNTVPLIVPLLAENSKVIMRPFEIVKEGTQRALTFHYPQSVSIASQIWETATPDPEFFRVVKAGESVPLRETTITLLIVKMSDGGRTNRLIEVGDYSLRVESRFFGAGHRDAKDAAARWASVGYLWLQPVVSEPAKLTIRDGQGARPCYGPPRLIDDP